MYKFKPILVGVWFFKKLGLKTFYDNFLLFINDRINKQFDSEFACQFSNASHNSRDARFYFAHNISEFMNRVEAKLVQNKYELDNGLDFFDKLSLELRLIIRSSAGLPADVPVNQCLSDQLKEIKFLRDNSNLIKPVIKLLCDKRVLYCGQCYYNPWYLSRSLRRLGWRADVYNWDENILNQIYYHGEDYKIGRDIDLTEESSLEFYINSIYRYDVFHFSNAHGLSFGQYVSSAFLREIGEHEEVRLLKSIGKIIVYSTNGCLDGVSQTAFSSWGAESVCSMCKWQNSPAVCSDEKNLTWGAYRNSVADYICLSGENRVDFNINPNVHEVPEFYCLDPNIWHPDIDIPDNYMLPSLPGGVRLYHAVGNRTERTRKDGVNIKSSHVYVPLVDKLKSEGLDVELIEPVGVPNKEVRFLQVQSDIFLDMLTVGWFGANAREAMMLGKPVICFLRPEWLESLRREIPDYANELPVISATPETVEFILRELIDNPEKRKAVGEQGRQFSLKWHSGDSAAKHFDYVYSQLILGNPICRIDRDNLHNQPLNT